MAENNYGIPTYERNVSRGRNPNYFVNIRSTAGLSVTADMPEQFNLAISNSWEPRFSAGLNELAGGLDTMTRLIGENIMIEEFSRMMWMNTSPIEIPITLLFDTERNAFEDVYKPMKSLETLWLPDRQGAFLTAPGPSVANPNRNKTSVFIGRAWFFPSVVPVSISTSYDMRLDSSGFPISGQAEITFSTDKVLAKADWMGG